MNYRHCITALPQAPVTERPPALPPVSVKRGCTMPQPNFDQSMLPPIARRRCPLCGLQMFLARIEPSEDVDSEERTFECSACAYGETVVVKISWIGAA